MDLVSNRTVENWVFIVTREVFSPRINLYYFLGGSPNILIFSLIH